MVLMISRRLALLGLKWVLNQPTGQTAFALLKALGRHKNVPAWNAREVSLRSHFTPRIGASPLTS